MHSERSTPPAYDTGFDIFPDNYQYQDEGNKEYFAGQNDNFYLFDKWQNMRHNPLFRGKGGAYHERNNSNNEKGQNTHSVSKIIRIDKWIFLIN